MKNINEIIQAIANAHEQMGYDAFGVRTDNREVKIGEDCECSHDWDYENDCQSDNYLDGTSATSFGYLYFDEEDENNVREAIAYNLAHYVGKTTYIIGGKRENYGMDENETIIEDATVIYVF